MILDSVYPVQNGLLASEIFMKLYSAPHGKYLPCIKALYSAEIVKPAMYLPVVLHGKSIQWEML